MYKTSILVFLYVCSWQGDRKGKHFERQYEEQAFVERVTFFTFSGYYLH